MRLNTHRCVPGASLLLVLAYHLFVKFGEATEWNYSNVVVVVCFHFYNWIFFQLKASQQMDQLNMMWILVLIYRQMDVQSRTYILDPDSEWIGISMHLFLLYAKRKTEQNEGATCIACEWKPLTVLAVDI